MPRRPKRNCDNNPLERGLHAVDLKKFAKASINCFFMDKKWFCGGKIPESQLYTDDNIKTVLRTPFDEPTFDLIHKYLTKVPKKKGYDDSCGVPWTVTFLISMLEQMAQFHIPKEFQPGLVLLYFKFCWACPIPAPPKL